MHDDSSNDISINFVYDRKTDSLFWVHDTNRTNASNDYFSLFGRNGSFYH